MKQNTTRHLVVAPLLFAVIGLLGPMAPQAMASVPQPPGGDPWKAEDGASPTAVTRSVKVTVKEVREDRTLVIEDDNGLHSLTLSPEVEVRAQSKKEFDGRKKLRFEDLQAGQRLKVTFMAKNGQIVRIQVLKARRA